MKQQNNREANEHSLFKSLVLHLVPGIIGGILYYLLAPLVQAYGYPSVMALSLAGILGLGPFELGFLWYRKRKTGRKFFGEIVRYLQPLPMWQYFVWIPLILISSGLLFNVFSITHDILLPLFSWVPQGFFLDMGLDESFSQSKLIITYGVFLFAVVIILPAIEELYFRGYLLPRMPARLKDSSILIHSFFFALYHTWSPWMIITRTFGVLPLIYIVKKKKNIYLGIIAHCLLNSIDFVVAVVYLSGR